MGFPTKIAPTAAEPALELRAPAKINLDLLVTGQREDGYHELDSLVVFPEFGDRLFLTPAETFSLTIEGPMAAGLDAGPDNLVWRAAMLLAETVDRPANVAVRLDKHLPLASGLGGGSSDAAAMMRGLLQFWQVKSDAEALRDLGQQLGADLPVCLYARPARMRGTGERLDPVRGLPELPLLLVNPGVSVATGEVFKHFELATAAIFREPLRPFPSIVHFAHWLGSYPNELEVPAIEIVPEIADVLHTLRTLPDCLLARMSGSGASCFGLFKSASALELAAQTVRQHHPEWWSVATEVSGS